ncbi:hypothetical protein CWC18_12370 [Pseudoalteromonas aurantia]|uniref:hypothetical protein n=1 Tax=Pseudoalteromonas aurantia TaxID=43654 RepID=UPI00110B72B8|nr:hypothetical protein [Pseudoalteromonas aurantia]TMO61012.1 hypothetical protein CWC18_12370 [Pseudoalteromonas aurantia]
MDMLKRNRKIKIIVKACLTCILTALSIKAYTSEIVKIELGDEIYSIPKNYLSPNEGLRNAQVANGMVEIGMFLPDYSGYSGNRNLPTVGPYDENQISAFWTSKGTGKRLDAQYRLDNGLKYNLVKRSEEDDILGLVAYRHSHNKGISYIGRNTFGYLVEIDCFEKVINQLCKAQYYDEKEDIGLFFSFDHKHLSQWTDINKVLITKMLQWKA